MNKEDSLPTQHPPMSKQTAVLCVNLGTPKHANYWGIRRFLAEFLSDKRVIDTPRWIWWPILYGVILLFRPLKIAKQYRSIWVEQGSPLLDHSKKLIKKLQHQLDQEHPNTYTVALAMRYGEPSISEALSVFATSRIQKLIVLPLYPQYSATTTASVFDGVSNALKQTPYLPEMHWIQHYADHPAYIDALCHSVTTHWENHGKDAHLLITFHGIPQRYFDQGDPYYCYCHKTARLMREQLGLKENEATLVFQSRFGPSAWLGPACDITIASLAKQGVKNLAVIAPGFAADCLETLEELCVTNKVIFLSNGGDYFHYIPALNSSDKHSLALCALVSQF